MSKQTFQRIGAWTSDQVAIAKSLKVYDDLKVAGRTAPIASICSSDEKNVVVDFYGDQRGLINIHIYSTATVVVTIPMNDFFKAVDTLRKSIQFDEQTAQ